MTKSSMKKISLLGFVLIAASAVTAAIVPAKAKDSAGKLAASTGGGGNQLTCIATVNPTGCNITVGTSTTDVNSGGSGPRNTNGTSITPNSSAGRHSSGSPE